ncbi:polyprotein 2 [Black pepper virus F]|nr:polyprotein 2 [Black pepper virus F]
MVFLPHVTGAWYAITEIIFYTIAGILTNSEYRRADSVAYVRCNTRDLKYHIQELWRQTKPWFLFLSSCLIHLTRTTCNIVKTRVMEGSKRFSDAIPSDVLLERAKHYKEAIVARKSMLPSAEETFSSQWRRLSNFGIKDFVAGRGNGAVLRTDELDLGAMGTNTVKYFEVPLYEERSCAAVDDRINPASSAMRQRKCHTAAVEIGVDSLASGTSDLVMGAVLYDKRHQNPRNAIKGAFCTSLAARNTRVLMYPDHHVSLQNSPNKSLELAVVTPNNDMREQDIVAHLKVRAISQIVNSDTQSTVTKGVTRLGQIEKMSVVKYFDTNCVHFTPTEQEFSIPDIVIPLNHGIRMKQIDNCTWIREDIEVKNFTLANRLSKLPYLRKESGTDDELSDDAGATHLKNASIKKGKGKLYAEGQANVSSGISEDFLQVQTGSSITTQLAHIHTEIFNVGLTTKAGKVIVDVPMNKLALAEGNFSKYLEVVLRNRSSIKVRIQCNSTSTSGIALKAGFVPASLAFSSDMPPNIFNELDAVIWNPATGDTVDLTFNPISCTHTWNQYVVGQINDADVPRFVMIALTEWLQAPDNEMRGSLTIYVDSTIECQPRIYKPYELLGLKFGKYLGDMRFKQGSGNKGYWCDASLGNPSRFGSQYFYTLETALLGLYRYYKADLVFEFVRASSPFLCGNFVCALLPYDVAKKVTVDSIFRFNHVQFTVTGAQSKYTVRFPWDLNGMWQSTDQWNPFSDKVDKPSLVLVVFPVGSINSNLKGDMCLAVSVYPAGKLEGMGLTAGYPCTRQRGAFKDSTEDTPVKVTDEKEVMAAEGQMKTPLFPTGIRLYQDIAKYKPAAGTKGKTVATLLFGSFHTTNFELQDSPLLRVLKSATWMSGAVHFRVQWIAKSIQWNERSATFGMFVYETRKASNCLFREFSHVPSGCFEFTLECNGPHDGFMNTKWHISGEKRSSLMRFTTHDAEDLSVVYITAAFGDDFYVSGSGDVDLRQSTQIESTNTSIFNERSMFEVA